MRAAKPSKCSEERRRAGEVQGMHTMTAVVSCATTFYYSSIKMLYCKRDSSSHFYCSLITVTTLLSSWYAFRQREKDYNGILYLSCKYILPLKQSGGKWRWHRQPRDFIGLNVFTTSLSYYRAVQAWSGQMSGEKQNKTTLQCSKTAAGVRPGVQMKQQLKGNRKKQKTF